MERLSQCLPLFLSPPPPSTKTRGMHLRKCAGACLCFSFPLYLKGPKGEGDKGGEGSLGGWGYPPKVCHLPLDTTGTPVLIFLQFEHQHNYLKEEPNTTGKPRDPTRGLNRPSPSQRPCSRDPRHKQTSPSPHPTGSRVPFPDPQAMERRPGSLSFQVRLLTEKPFIGAE